MNTEKGEDVWRGSSRCTHCSMFIYLEHENESVIDVVMAAAMEAHRLAAHPETESLDLTTRVGFVELPDGKVSTHTEGKLVN